MIKQILSTKINDTQVNIALLLLRVVAGVLMAHHGYQKLTGFAEIEPQFMEFLGLSKGISLGLVVFSEFFCSLFLVLGIATRFTLVPLIITMIVAVFSAHAGDIFGKGEIGTLYLGIYLVLLIAGAGKYSVDNFLFNKE
jgi:putative oxidoreductase